MDLRDNMRNKYIFLDKKLEVSAVYKYKTFLTHNYIVYKYNRFVMNGFCEVEFMVHKGVGYILKNA